MNEKNIREYYNSILPFPVQLPVLNTALFLESILKNAINLKASDIHFEPQDNRFRIRFRLDGILIEVVSLHLNRKEEIISRIKVLSDLDIAEKRKPQDGKFVYSGELGNADIRVSTLNTTLGEKVVLRVLVRDQYNLDLESLGYSIEAAEKIRKAMSTLNGMILVTGPTGSGKSTTIFSALQEINKEKHNITTIEDPVEYRIKGINQTQIVEEIGLDFPRVLRSILRQDPDIIMVGEIRDEETAKTAIRSALTGHLVFSTLHTNDAVSTLTRLNDIGVPSYLIVSSVKIIIAQRLVRIICPHCRTKRKKEDVLYPFKGITEFYYGKGCHECKGLGYKGRTAIYEILEVNNRIAELFMKQAATEEIYQTAAENGMISLSNCAVQKINQGITTVEEVIEKVIL
ncbi:MAG: GspE/PulE family protein [Candidatus Cloacimonetes bacterium]|nr:GspE/PulE family protein [Candidatus Cloacimonadota bacterium]